MGKMEGPNHPCVVWGACFLWLASVLAITWSLVLFFCIGDMLLVTGTDVVIALILLSGVIMFPTNIYMLYTIGNGQKISHKSRVLCCPLWMLLTWIIIINCVGIILCIQRMCMVNTMDFIVHSMRHYRSEPRYKHFMDNLQWSLKCCGLDSYKDWFNYDWFEKLRDYEWAPSSNKMNADGKNELRTVSDSVPLSCCKSGTCMPNYLLELGTHSIHTKGCHKSMYRIYMTSMNVHLIIFLTIVIAEIIILTCIIAGSKEGGDCQQSPCKREYNIKHLMPVNNRFVQSCSSTSVCQDEEDDDDGDEEENAEDSDFALKSFYVDKNCAQGKH